MYRLTKRTVKLSELYTVYWEYVEKARRFVRERGNSEFGEGSESNAVPRIWKKYGIVPEDAYPGLQPGQKFHDHGSLFAEMRDYLQSVRSQNAWNEEQVIGTIRDILNHYLGTPPTSVTAGGATMTPREYLEKVVHLNFGDYVEFMSLMEKPYYAKTEYPASDNWWHSSDYYNVPLDDFMAIIRKAVRSGHSLCIGGDTSEPGLDGHAGVAVIPSFDIPPAMIDENAREFRFTNGTTGDDHGIHIVGYTEKDGKDWYLVKDSGSGSRNNSHPGYSFFREDYVKLKMLDFTVHREVAGRHSREMPEAGTVERADADRPPWRNRLSYPRLLFSVCRRDWLGPQALYKDRKRFLPLGALASRLDYGARISLGEPRGPGGDRDGRLGREVRHDDGPLLLGGRPGDGVRRGVHDALLLRLPRPFRSRIPQAAVR